MSRENPPLPLIDNMLSNDNILSSRTRTWPGESRDAVTDLVLEVFRLNGELIAMGDAMVAEIGLTSARWQVLGAIALSNTPLPIAQIARNMGLTRQAVQRVANELEAEGFVRFAPNPHHQRAKLCPAHAQGRGAPMPTR